MELYTFLPAIHPTIPPLSELILKSPPEPLIGFYLSYRYTNGGNRYTVDELFASEEEALRYVVKVMQTKKRDWFWQVCPALADHPDGIPRMRRVGDWRQLDKASGQWKPASTDDMKMLVPDVPEHCKRAGLIYAPFEMKLLR